MHNAMKYKIYMIETKSAGGVIEYRFRSLFNSCVGFWTSDKLNAIQQGEQHAKLIIEHLQGVKGI